MVVWVLKVCSFIKKYGLYAMHASKHKGSPLFCPTACAHGARDTAFSEASEQITWSTLLKFWSLKSPFASCLRCGSFLTCIGTTKRFSFTLFSHSSSTKHFCNKKHWGFVAFIEFPHIRKEKLIKSNTEKLKRSFTIFQKDWKLRSFRQIHNFCNIIFKIRFCECDINYAFLKCMCI